MLSSVAMANQEDRDAAAILIQRCVRSHLVGEAKAEKEITEWLAPVGQTELGEEDDDYYGLVKSEEYRDASFWKKTEVRSPRSRWD